jgi:4-amino-4-deoxy-L-arabinose transferase-like glycosyltransferase
LNGKLQLKCENWKREAAVFLIICVIAGFSLFFRLGQGSLHDWDEAIYAQVSKEMIHDGDWLTQHYEYKPWFEKPPLLMWCTAFFFHLFGVTEFWSRVASASAGIAVLVVTYLLGKTTYCPRTGFVSVLVLLSSAQFVRYARRDMIETMLMLFVVLAIYGYVRMRRGHPCWWYLIWSSCALALLAKSLAMMVVPATLALALLLDGLVPAALRCKHFWLGALAALVIAAPWHIIMYVQYRQAFVDSYLLFNASRLTNSLQENTGGPFFYFNTLRTGFFPWLYLLPFAVIGGLREIRRNKVESRVLLLWIVIVFGVYGVARTKILWYVLPAYPALAILIGSLFVGAWRSYRSFAFVGMLIATGVAAFSLPKSFGAALGSAAFLILMFMFSRKREERYRALAFLAAVFLLAIGIRSVLPLYSEREAPVAKLAHMARSANASDCEPLVVFAGIPRPAALFYSDRPIVEAETREQLAEVMAGYKPQRIILPIKDVDSLGDSYRIRINAKDSGFAYATIIPLEYGSP